MAAGSTLIFGRYYPQKSVLHRLDARVKLIAMLVLMIVCFIVRDYWGMLAMCALTTVLFVLARIPFRVAFRAAAPLLVFAVLTAILNLFTYQNGSLVFSWWFIRVYSGGLWASGFYGLRLALMVFIACLLTLTTPVLAIVKASAVLLGPLRRIGVPVSEISMMAGMAIRFLPLFADELATIRQARQARGALMSFNPFRGGLKTVASLIIPLFVSAFRHAETISAAMDARCFNLSEQE